MVTLVVRPPTRERICSTIYATASISKNLQSVNGLPSARYGEMQLVENRAAEQWLAQVLTDLASAYKFDQSANSRLADELTKVW